jgi:hypothetical protein
MTTRTHRAPAHIKCAAGLSGSQEKCSASCKQRAGSNRRADLAPSAASTRTARTHRALGHIAADLPIGRNGSAGRSPGRFPIPDCKCGSACKPSRRSARATGAQCASVMRLSSRLFSPLASGFPFGLPWPSSSVWHSVCHGRRFGRHFPAAWRRSPPSRQAFHAQPPAWVAPARISPLRPRAFLRRAQASAPQQQA